MIRKSLAHEADSIRHDVIYRRSRLRGGNSYAWQNVRLAWADVLDAIAGLRVRRDR